MHNHLQSYLGVPGNEVLHTSTVRLAECSVQLNQLEHVTDPDMWQTKLECFLMRASGYDDVIGKIHLQILIDMGRNQLAVICGYKDWKEWRESKEVSTSGDKRDMHAAMIAEAKAILQKQDSNVSESWKVVGQQHLALRYIINGRRMRAREEVVEYTATREAIRIAVSDMAYSEITRNMGVIFDAVFDEYDE
ncbi:uncharacterized protein EDB93DRAFT_1109294 [Suillus bovinus]|uniref:uncharacterized protein n=1 Tax=Suillus bovinus TaxID=48563 RepID=UPI001B8776FA|nr:uncharacterized protein EDB93DRAFT_1109294 [Suillus bovinus]KAG2127466.1 hypothetical protein EDB93DRAFT_1109294 [Suillus bovinus]